MTPVRHLPEHKALARELLAGATLPRDALPYSKEFDELRAEFTRKTGVSKSQHEFWLLLARVGKEGGVRSPRRKVKRAPSLTPEQQLEVLRLCPEYVGSRDRLPYTREFDDIWRRYKDVSGQRLSKHEFWRVLSRVAKSSRKPKPVAVSPEKADLPAEMIRFLQDSNPWWLEREGPPVARYRRWIFGPVLERLKGGLTPILAIRGARQVGKTTVQQQVIEHLLKIEHVDPERILRVQFDRPMPFGSIANPILAIIRWYEEHVLHDSLNAAARKGRPVYVLLDELQEVRDWAPQLKSLVDMRQCRMLVTGSSALRIGEGKDSLAGRLSMLELGPLRLWEVAALGGLGSLSPFQEKNHLSDWTHPEFWRELVAYGRKHDELVKKAFSLFSEKGGYPRYQANRDTTPEQVAEGVVLDVVDRTLTHDLRQGKGGRSRDTGLLREVFRLACKYAGQAPQAGKLASEVSAKLDASVSPPQIAQYLEFLAGALLIHLVEPLQLRLKRQTMPDKICLLDHMVRAGWLQETIPLDPSALRRGGHLSDLAGHIVESLIGYYLMGIPGLELAHFPAKKKEPEVDFVITIGEHRIPVEVKYRRQPTRPEDLAGLNHFIEKKAYGSKFGLLICQEPGPEKEGIIQIPAWYFLLVR